MLGQGDFIVFYIEVEQLRLGHCLKQFGKASHSERRRAKLKNLHLPGAAQELAESGTALRRYSIPVHIFDSRNIEMHQCFTAL